MLDSDKEACAVTWPLQHWKSWCIRPNIPTSSKPFTWFHDGTTKAHQHQRSSYQPDRKFIRSSKSTAGAPMLIAHEWRTFCGLPGPYQALCFIQLDRSAHHVKKTCEGNKLKTAFRTRNGRLEYQTMRLSATFQTYSYTEGPGQHHGGMLFPSRWGPTIEN